MRAVGPLVEIGALEVEMEPSDAGLHRSAIEQMESLEVASVLRKMLNLCAPEQGLRQSAGFPSAEIVREGSACAAARTALQHRPIRLPARIMMNEVQHADE